MLAWIDEQWCIGCTLCISACPTDAIIGSNKHMHSVIEENCTGCELCLPVCPVDCILLENASGTATGWEAWGPEQAAEARKRYALHQLRLPLQKPESVQPAQKQAVIEAALAAAQSKRTHKP